MELKAMTFNLRVSCEEDGGNAWPHRKLEAAEAIKAAGAAIVCTQEGTYPMLQELHALLPEYDWLGEGRLGGNEDEFCAVFYLRAMLEPVDSGNFGLSEFPDRPGYSSWNTACPRMCTWVRVRLPDGRESYIFNTHLDHMSPEARTNGIRLIVERIQNMHGPHRIPAIVAGDFNSGPDSDVVHFLNEAGLINAYSAVADQAVGCTYHGFDGGEAGEPIDFIFLTPELKVTSTYVDRNAYNDRYPSDHYPVITVVRF
jgi:endonuclease/exonuclease/phosphatase family metal-dependent hydrolase